MHTALIFRERILAPSETFIAEQAKALRRYRPILTGLRRTQPSLDHLLPEILLRDGHNIIDRFAASLYRKFPLGNDFFRRLRAAEPAIVHAHFAIDAVQALTIAHRLNLPLIVSLHGYDVNSSASFLRQSRSGTHFLLNRDRLFREATAFLCVSRFIYDAALRAGFPSEKLHVHYTGIDCERFSAVDLPRDPKLILFVGRLVEVKGCEHLLRALAVLQHHDSDVHAEIIGDGPLRAKLEALASSLSLRVSFRGMQSQAEVRRSMFRARILCNPSITASTGEKEAFGMVFAEAQASGTPVVSYANAAIPEVVNHGQTGLLCPEGDIGALADALRILLENNDQWTSMSARAREWVKMRFDIARQTERLELLYDECVARHRHSESTTGEQRQTLATNPIV